MSSTGILGSKGSLARALSSAAGICQKVVVTPPAEIPSQILTLHAASGRKSSGTQESWSSSLGGAEFDTAPEKPVCHHVAPKAALLPGPAYE